MVERLRDVYVSQYEHPCSGRKLSPGRLHAIFAIEPNPVLSRTRLQDQG